MSVWKLYVSCTNDMFLFGRRMFPFGNDMALFVKPVLFYAKKGDVSDRIWYVSSSKRDD